MLYPYAIIAILLLQQSNSYAQEKVWKKTVTREISIGRQKDDKKLQERTLLEVLIKEIKAGILPAYSSVDHDFTTRMKPDDMAINTWQDTIIEPDPVTGNGRTIVRIRNGDLQTIHIYRTLEEWAYSPETGTTNIQIKRIAPVREVYGDDGVFRGVQAMFWVKYEDVVQDIMKYERQHPHFALLSKIWKDNFSGKVPGMNVYAVRTINMRQAEDTVKHHLRDDDNDSTLQQIVANEINTGRLPVYQAPDYSFKAPLSLSQLKKMTLQLDTILVTDPLENTELYTVRTSAPFATKDTLQLIEQWSGNTTTGTIHIQLICLAIPAACNTHAAIKPLLIPYIELLPALSRYNQYHPTHNTATQIWDSYFLSDNKVQVARQ